MCSKNYQNMEQAIEEFMKEARENSVLATFFLALGGDENIYLSQRFYFALKDIISPSLVDIAYEDKTQVITIKDEKKGTNYIIELITVEKYDEELYFVRKAESKYLNYNANMQEPGIGNILRLESEKNNQV